MELIQSYLTQNPCFQANVCQADSRYTAFQTRGPQGLMLHAVGCAQPRAEVFCRRWNDPAYDKACVHAFIDAKTGAVRQTLPWSFRGWHCGGSGNDTHLGVEMCESDAIRYVGGSDFEILNRQTALADCARAYASAVELFALLCQRYCLDPMTAVCSHREGGRAGIASGHVDPEHYWSGLGTDYTMDGFRSDVAAALAALGGQDEPAEPEPAPQPEPESQQSPPEAPAPALPFPDVAADAWYADALRWAVENRIILPGGAPFRPEAPLTKAAAVVLLRRLYRALSQQ